MWDVHYDRLSINLIAIMGDDVIEMGPMPKDDEELITTIYSKQTGRRKPRSSLVWPTPLSRRLPVLVSKH